MPNKYDKNGNLLTGSDKGATYATTFQNAVVATGNGTVMDVGGLATIAVTLSGWGNATCAFEANTDGSTWQAISAYDVALRTWATTATINGLVVIPVAGFSQVRCRISIYTSGTLTVTGIGAVAHFTSASASSGSSTNQGTANTLANGWPVQVTDLTHTMPTMDVAARAGFVQVTNGTQTMPTGDAAARPIFVEVTNGTQNLPTMDAAARAGYIYVTNGTQTLPTMDAAARAGFVELTDGTRVITVKPASTGALATDTALVVRPMAPTDGTNTTPTMDAAARAGYVYLTNGTQTLPTMDAIARAGFVQVSDGTHALPGGDATARPIYVRLGDATTANIINTSGVIPVANTVLELTNTPTITANVYANGQAIGGLITWTNAALVSGGSFTVASVTITDKTLQKAPIDVIFFNANPAATTFTDRVALVMNTADLVRIRGFVSVLGTSYTAFTLVAAATVAGVGLPIILSSTSTLYACLVCRGTPTYASTSDLTVTVQLVQD